MITLRFLSLYVLTGICSSIFNLSYANSIVYPSYIEKGRVYSFPLNVYSNYTSSGGSIHTIEDYGALFSIDTKYSLNGFNAYCLSSSLFSWTSDKRYYGLTVAKDTVIAIVNATSDTKAYLRNGDVTPSKYTVYSGGGSWDAQGVFTPTFPLPSGKTWCSGKPFDNTLVSQINSPLPGINGTLTGTLVLYAGPNADFGLINIPLLYWSLPFRGDEIASSQSIQVIKSRECTISAPPIIDFGTVSGFGVPENDFLKQVSGELRVQCGPGGDASLAKIQLIGDALPKYGYILPMKNSDGESAPGEIRGWVNRTPVPTTKCSGGASSSGELFFGDSSKWYDVGEISDGSNTIPYVFNLCGSGANKSANLGPASATAVVNLSWE